MALTTLHRTMSADLLNEVANDETVRPFVGGVGPVDVSDTVGNPQNIALIGPSGGFVFVRDEPTRFELHTLLRGDGRGAAVLPAAAEAFNYIFTATDALEILTRIPASNKAADLMARRAGFTPIFTRTAAWPDGSDVNFFVLTLDAWRAADATLVTSGEAFHDLLQAAKPDDIHPHDEAHERAVGSAVQMILAGNASKAVWTYNRWARLAGYATIELLSVAPVVVDVQDALIGLSEGKLEVLLCR